MTTRRRQIDYFIITNKLRTHLVCVEQLKNVNPLSIVTKLILVRLDLKLKSTTAVSSVLVIRKSLNNTHYLSLHTHTITSITELFYNKGIVTGQISKVYSRNKISFQ